ncbi:unnamed protein product [Oncorhynchus mykiss]|uniref:protein kinase C n=1 Tax=Oncorhynchus mykiss TaxID=8022 RepID=A0A060VZH7_ONCMY|nr:unnamed protein product [Oncorhynchus mykiss]
MWAHRARPTREREKGLVLPESVGRHFSPKYDLCPHVQRFWSSGFFLAERPFRLCRYRARFTVDIDTFVPVSPSIFTRSFVVVPSGVWKLHPRMNQTCGAYCGHCSERIWGLGRQGYKCINCKLLVHKRCHTLVPLTCQRHMEPVMPSQEPPLDEKSEEVDLLPQDTEDTDGIPFLPHNCKMDKVEEDSEDIKAVVDGIEGIKISQGLALGLGDFDLIRVIGRGSYAKVLLVRLKKNEQIYAMKVVKKELVHDDEDIDWVQTEKHVFEQASTNPFLVGLHSCFQTESRLFLVIEYVNGGDLMFHMQRQRKLPEEHARFYAAEICIALNFLHEKGILYRDLKLDNVLLDHEGHIKLTDYGMCKEGIRPGDTTSTFCGTPNYIAPEILRGEDYGFSVDWWALGVLMFEMMAGRSPFDIITDNPDMNTEEYLFQVILEKPIRIPRSLSVKAASVLKGFLNKDPKERLGCQVQTGFSDIKSHTFFRSIDWDQVSLQSNPLNFRRIEVNESV